MTSPPEKIRVRCPRCETEYDDWMRSVNLDLDNFDEAYLAECSTARCPACGFVVDLETLVVKGNVWRWGGARGAWSASS